MILTKQNLIFRVLPTNCRCETMVGRLLQSSTMYICMQQSILIQLQHGIFSFNDYIHSTSTRALFSQQIYSLNFKTGYFCARRIFIQLQPPKLRFLERIYLFNFNKNIFIQQNIFIQLFASSRTSINSYSTNLHLPIPLLPIVKKEERDLLTAWRPIALEPKRNYFFALTSVPLRF